MIDRPLIRGSIYAGTAVVVFAVAFLFSFPDQRLKEVVTVQIQKVVSNDYNVQIGDIDIWWLGLDFEQITLERASSQPTNKPEGQAKNGDGPSKTKRMSVTIPSFGVRFGILSSIVNLGPTGVFSMSIGSGSVGGTATLAAGGRHVGLEVDNVKLQEVSELLRSVANLPASGNLEGSAELHFHSSKPILIDGDIDLNGYSLLVGPGTIKSAKFGPMAFVDVPETHMGRLQVDLVVDKPQKAPPRLKFQNFSLKGQHLRGEAWGHIELGRKIQTSRAKIQMRVQFAKNYVSNNDLSSIFDTQWFQNGKRGNWYGFLLWGPLGKPNFRGASNAAQGPSAAKKPKK